MNKTTEQIAEDCGLYPANADAIKEILRGGSNVYSQGVFERLEHIIGALYRRIEKLENGPDEAEEGADVCSVCDAVFAPKTLLAINEAEFELICPECMLARIKKLEEVAAEFRAKLGIEEEM